MTYTYTEVSRFLPTVAGWFFLFTVSVVTSPVGIGVYVAVLARFALWQS